MIHGLLIYSSRSRALLAYSLSVLLVLSTLPIAEGSFGGNRQHAQEPGSSRTDSGGASEVICSAQYASDGASYQALDQTCLPAVFTAALIIDEDPEFSSNLTADCWRSPSPVKLPEVCAHSESERRPQDLVVALHRLQI